MRFLTANDSLTVTFGCLRFTGSAVKADPDTIMFAAITAGPATTFKTKIGLRNDATDHVADTQGVVAFRERQLREVVMTIGRKAFAHFGARTAPGYLKILPRAPSEIVVLPLADRRKVVLAIVDALGEKGLPADLAQLGKDLAATQKNRDTADADVVTAEIAVTKARAAENDARDAVLVAYRSLHAQLTLKFPNDKPRVESYFRSPVVKKAKVAVVAG